MITNDKRIQQHTTWCWRGVDAACATLVMSFVLYHNNNCSIYFYSSFSPFLLLLLPTFPSCFRTVQFTALISIPTIRVSVLYWNGQLVCTPASTALFACMSGTVSRLYRHIRQAAIPARVVLGTATRRASRRPL